MKPVKVMRYRATGSSSGAVNSDDFSTDTTSLYTMDKATGSPAGSISGGVLTINASTSGEEAAYTRNGTSILDGYVEADIDYAQDSGLVGRYQSYSTYYLMTACDDSGSNPSANIRLFKRVSGTYTQIGTANITWPRGTQKTVRLSFFGSAIKALVDGVEVISVTDTGITSAGRIGVRANAPGSGPYNKYNALRWT